MIQYVYALDSLGKLCHISGINSDNRHHQYHCPNCQNTLIPRLGNIRDHQIEHKHEIPNCSFESYLHKTAKHVFYERFQFAREFNEPMPLQFWQRCNTSQIYVQYPGLEKIDCPEYLEHNLDLATRYDQIELEKKYGNFQPDILLSSSKHNDVLLVEIKVTHSCSQEKINAEHQIMEIEIQSQDDLWRLKTEPLKAPYQKLLKQERVLNIELHHFPEFAPEQISSTCSCREEEVFGTTVFSTSNKHLVLKRSYNVYWKLRDVPTLHRKYKGKKNSFLHFDLVENHTKEECKIIYHQNLKKAETQGIKVVYKRSLK